MDFLLELLFGFFFEMPMEMTTESKRLKPWVKTALMFVTINILTVLMLFIAFIMHKNADGNLDGIIALVLAVICFVGSIVACIHCHKRGWRMERTCSLEKTAAKGSEYSPEE